jgi:hypothetical protein
MFAQRANDTYPMRFIGSQLCSNRSIVNIELGVSTCTRELGYKYCPRVLRVEDVKGMVGRCRPDADVAPQG